jgi:hypothetical protein
MKKVAIIEHCKACPHSTYITTIDPKHPRIYLGCHLADRSFDVGIALTDRPQIPGWCPLPDAKYLIAFKESFPLGEPIHPDVWNQFCVFREQEKREGR